MKKQNESAIVKMCLDFLHLHGIFSWRNNSTGIYDPTRKVFRSFHGMKGTSDILGCLPDGKFLAVECKVKGNQASQDQAEFLSKVWKNGGIGLLVTDVKELECSLRDDGYI